MTLDMQKTGRYLQQCRKRAGLTQAEFGERINVTAQSVSNWERGESLPDVGILPDIALILDTSIDEILGGGSCAWLYRRRVTVEKMREAVGCVRRLRELLGSDHFMYRTMIDALDKSMNSEIEPAFYDEGIMDAYVCEALLACVEKGDYVDTDDVRSHIASEKPRAWTLRRLAERDMK